MNSITEGGKSNINENDLKNISANLAEFFQNGVCYLSGNLGSGKTTFVRYFLRALNFKGAVKSPTYTIIESYNVQNKLVNHLDLYRLIDGSEVLLIGLEDLIDEHLTFIEWPDKAISYIPAADVQITFTHNTDTRNIKWQIFNEKFTRWHDVLQNY